MAKSLSLLNESELVAHFDSLHKIFDTRARSFCAQRFKQILRKSVNGEFKRVFTYSDDSHRYKTQISLLVVDKSNIAAANNALIYTTERDINTSQMVAIYFLTSFGFDDRDENDTVDTISIVNIHFLKRFYQRHLGIEKFPSFEEMADTFAKYLNETAVMGGKSRKLFYKNKVKNTVTNFLESSDGDYIIFEQEGDYIMRVKTFISHDMLTKGQFALYEKEVLYSFADILTTMENDRNKFGCMAAYSMYKQARIFYELKHQSHEE